MPRLLLVVALLAAFAVSSSAENCNDAIIAFNSDCMDLGSSSTSCPEACKQALAKIPNAQECAQDLMDQARDIAKVLEEQLGVQDDSDAEVEATKKALELCGIYVSGGVSRTASVIVMFSALAAVAAMFA